MIKEVFQILGKRNHALLSFGCSRDEHLSRLCRFWELAFFELEGLL
jgi:hypothetical protein